ncbi:MAG TPA: SDR family oxidoreductase [Bryobacteraceae bacterium]|jgi:glucose 1-dehydrogenase|nr:SDR family oxidoreductase [Bryobacteraceae bacterium]
MRLDGKAAIVTGGASGIGRATALELAAYGADVAVLDLAAPAQSATLLEEIEKLGRRAIYFHGDVGDRATISELIEQTVTGLGRVDILVNNAGINIRKPLLELEVEDVEKVWHVILWGTFHCSQLAARQMVKQGEGGSIVNISSVHAYRPFAASTAYNGAKAAINHMAATWAAELAQHRIRVNSIEPGWIDTPGERRTFASELLEKEGKKLPLGRLGQPEEIARAVRFLASDDASYITGTILRVDGGFILPR